MDLYDYDTLGARKCHLLLYHMDGRCSTLTRLESDSSAYIGIFLLTSNQSLMSDYHLFPISKWRNLIRPMLCLGKPLPAHRRIGVTD